MRQPVEKRTRRFGSRLAIDPNDCHRRSSPQLLFQYTRAESACTVGDKLQASCVGRPSQAPNQTSAAGCIVLQGLAPAARATGVSAAQAWRSPEEADLLTCSETCSTSAA